jgi:hypothetical protein
MKKLIFATILAFSFLSFMSPHDASAQRKIVNLKDSIYGSGSDLVMVVNGYPQYIAKSAITQIQTNLRTVTVVTNGNFVYSFNIPSDSSTPKFATTLKAAHYIDSLWHNGTNGGFKYYTHICAANSDSAVIASKPCKLVSLTIVNHTAGVRTIKLYDTTGAPNRYSGDGNSVSLAHVYTVQASSTLSINIPGDGIGLTKGLAIRYYGTTGFAKKESAWTTTDKPSANDIQVDIAYKY